MGCTRLYINNPHIYKLWVCNTFMGSKLILWSQIVIIHRYAWLIRSLSGVWWWMPSLLIIIPASIYFQNTYIRYRMDINVSNIVISRHAWLVRLEILCEAIDVLILKSNNFSLLAYIFISSHSFYLHFEFVAQIIINLLSLIILSLKLAFRSVLITSKQFIVTNWLKVRISESL